MTVAVPIQVFLVAAWLLSAIGGGMVGYYGRDDNNGGIFISIILFIVSLISLKIGMP